MTIALKKCGEEIHACNTGHTPHDGRAMNTNIDCGYITQRLPLWTEYDALLRSL